MVTRFAKHFAEADLNDLGAWVSHLYNHYNKMATRSGLSADELNAWVERSGDCGGPSAAGEADHHHVLVLQDILRVVHREHHGLEEVSHRLVALVLELREPLVRADHRARVVDVSAR